MRTSIILLLVGICALAYATPTPQENQFGKPYKVADKEFLEKQKDLLRLFKYIFQQNYFKDQTEIAEKWDWEQNWDKFNHQECVKEFVNWYKKGMLPRGEVFSVFYEVHRKQVKGLFNVMYNAKDWQTFYNVACWAREYMNEGMFVYAMHAAIFHRKDTQGIIMPAIYEIYPYFFVNSDVINKAYEYKMKYGGSYKGDKEKKFYIQANYSGWYLNSHPELHDMSYFTEDVGLNAYYYYFNMDYPFWMGGEEYGLDKDKRGELFYYFHQQLLARFYMERLSFDYGSIDVFDWREPIKTGYMSTMRYPNGLEFPSRPAYANIMYNPYNEAFTYSGEDNQFTLQELEDYERRIRDVIDWGYYMTEDGKQMSLYDKDGFDNLGKMIESSPDSPNNRLFGLLQVMAHRLLGYSSHPVNKYKVHPSALEHFETAMRDPIFYQFYKRIIFYFLKYKSNLPNYTYSELNFPGVKIENIYVDKLITYFDKYDWELTNALFVNEQEFEHDDFQIWARQWRLNHKPFTFKINVQSDKAQDVMVRVFLGPKFDENGHIIPMNDNRINFFEMDKFPYTLEPGKNTIERNSQQSFFVKDRTTYRMLYQKVMAALEGKEEFHLCMSEAHNGFPNRYMLPHGKDGGQVFQFYVYISPYTKKDITYDNVISAGVGTGERYFDDLPFGYPFDRQIKDITKFFVPNSFMEDVVIFHKTENEINTAYQH